MAFINNLVLSVLVALGISGAIVAVGGVASLTDVSVSLAYELCFAFLILQFSYLQILPN